MGSLYNIIIGENYFLYTSINSGLFYLWILIVKTFFYFSLEKIQLRPPPTSVSLLNIHNNTATSDRRGKGGLSIDGEYIYFFMYSSFHEFLLIKQNHAKIYRHIQYLIAFVIYYILKLYVIILSSGGLTEYCNTKNNDISYEEIPVKRAKHVIGNVQQCAIPNCSNCRRCDQS